MNKFTFLTQDFYNDYPISDYPEIENKVDRPYIQILLKVNNLMIAIPLRSHIKHPHVLWTDKKNGCGVDFSKSVIIIDEGRYIDKTRIPYIRPNEFKALRGKEYRIKQRFLKYVSDYKKAKENINDTMNKQLYSCSTLKYFENYITNINDLSNNT